MKTRNILFAALAFGVALCVCFLLFFPLQLHGHLKLAVLSCSKTGKSSLITLALTNSSSEILSYQGSFPNTTLKLKVNSKWTNVIAYPDSRSGSFKIMPKSTFIYDVYVADTYESFVAESTVEAGGLRNRITLFLLKAGLLKRFPAFSNAFLRIIPIGNLDAMTVSTLEWEHRREE